MLCALLHFTELWILDSRGWEVDTGICNEITSGRSLVEAQKFDLDRTRALFILQCTKNTYKIPRAHYNFLSGCVAPRFKLTV